MKAVRSSGRQHGVSLLFSLIALVALALAAVALTRSVNTGALVIGNLGFKQDATLASDPVAEQAITWIANNTAGTTLNNDVPASGYYATSLDALDPAGSQASAATRAVVDWDADNCANVSGAFSACIRPSPVVAIGDRRARYVITRLCATAGGPYATGNNCALPVSGASGGVSGMGASAYPGPEPEASFPAPYFRIVVRTLGARNTVSITETIVRF